ncbi:MAG TPA: insulinase family protein [Fimbriimonadaceae bacterium]|nr:insulinase family protein [Fimbriimonadaceae bacterium]
MLPLIATLALLQGQDQPPRLRTILENNSVILVEPMPAEPVISVQLFASSKYVPETEETHGFRHLVEHLIARGDGSLDRSLETKACFLDAHTLRDAMQIEVTVGPTQLQVALDALASVLKPPHFTQARIDKEMRIMRDELAMVDDSLLLSGGAWKAAYGNTGLDPLGTFDSMYRATPEQLDDVFARQFAGDGLVLAIAGPVDIDKATNMAKALLAPLPKGHFSKSTIARVGKPGRADAEGFGECRGAIVPSFDSPQTAAALAAALAIGSELSGCFVTYTPTTQPGLVILGRTSSTSGIGFYVDSLDSGSFLYERGKTMAREWVKRQLRSASGVAYFRGLLMCQGDTYKPEDMLRQIDALTPKEFEEGVKAFKSDRAAIAVGTR